MEGTTEKWIDEGPARIHRINDDISTLSIMRRKSPGVYEVDWEPDIKWDPEEGVEDGEYLEVVTYNGTSEYYGPGGMFSESIALPENLDVGWDADVLVLEIFTREPQQLITRPASTEIYHFDLDRRVSICCPLCQYHYQSSDWTLPIPVLFSPFHYLNGCNPPDSIWVRVFAP